MEKITIAKEKADHLRATFEDPPGLRIWSESESPDSVKYSRARLSTYLSAGIQHPGNRSHAYAGCFGNIDQ